MFDQDRKDLARNLAGVLALSAPPRLKPVAGGSIATAFRVESGNGCWFLKLMPAGEALAAEAEGLSALAATGTVRVPAVIDRGRQGASDWLLMEWLELRRPGDRAWRRLGERLAALHDLEQPAFGWRWDNFIGSTPQPNPRDRDWVRFFREARLGHQLMLARERGLQGRIVDRVSRLMEKLGSLIPGDVRPSLLHGDLWSGNLAAVGGEPVIFDPAAYCGHSEADLAMMELFGSPPESFQAAYREYRPLAPGYPLRRDLYNLYHLLNHFNLFAGAYAESVAATTERLLAELGP